MKYDLEMLRRLIKEKYENYSNFAKEINISKQLLSGKLTNRYDIFRDEIVIWSKKLGIPSEKMHVYFFTPLRSLV